MFKALVVAAAVCGLLVVLPSAGWCAQETPKGFMGVKLSSDGDNVVTVLETLVGSPAEKAGLRSGDIIVKVANVEAKDVNTVITTVTGFRPGDRINVEIKRDGKEMLIPVTLGERPKDID